MSVRRQTLENGDRFMISRRVQLMRATPQRIHFRETLEDPLVVARLHYLQAVEGSRKDREREEQTQNKIISR